MRALFLSSALLLTLATPSHALNAQETKTNSERVTNAMLALASADAVCHKELGKGAMVGELQDCAMRRYGTTAPVPNANEPVLQSTIVFDDLGDGMLTAGIILSDGVHWHGSVK